METRGKYRAFVLAGGSASRMNCDCPKALLRVQGRPLLEFTLSGLTEAGLVPVLVMTDRREYFDATVGVASRFLLVDVLPSQAAESTLQVVMAAVPYVAPRFLFVYGHAPRSAAHYSNLISRTSQIVVTRTLSSSKRKLIPAKDNGYIEPPYVLGTDNLLRTPAMTWAEFFLEQRGAVVEVPLVGPNEFNDPSEYRLYSEYVFRLWFQSDPLSPTKREW